jgi:hypothetical protein
MANFVVPSSGSPGDRWIGFATEDGAWPGGRASREEQRCLSPCAPVICSSDSCGRSRRLRRGLVLVPSALAVFGFGSAINFGAGTAPVSVTLGDPSGDGKPDLAAAFGAGWGSDSGEGSANEPKQAAGQLLRRGVVAAPGKVSFDKKPLEAKAGKVTIELRNDRDLGR